MVRLIENNDFLYIWFKLFSFYINVLPTSANNPFISDIGEITAQCSTVNNSVGSNSALPYSNEMYIAVHYSKLDWVA